jgi:hypothetical protein
VLVGGVLCALHHRPGGGRIPDLRYLPLLILVGDALDES